MGLRLAVAVAVLVSALVHLQLWLDGLRAVPVVGPGFLLNAVGGAVLAVAVLGWRHWLPLLAAVGFGAATLAAFAVSVTVGLFGVQERLLGGPQLLAGVSEVAAVLLGVWALRRERLTRVGPHRRRPAASRGRAGAERGR